MNPELKALEDRIMQLENQLRSFQSAAQLDPVIQNTIKLIAEAAISEASINDLLDVDASGATNGQVLKFTTTGVDRWINGTDIDT